MGTNQPRTMSGFSELLIWILPSAASLVMATGYIIEVSFQEFLGVFVETEESTYLLGTVKFGLDVIEALQKFMERHLAFGAISFLILMIIGACYVFVHALRVQANKILEWRHAIPILITFFFILFLYQIISFWIPSREIDDVLVKPAIFDRGFKFSQAKDIWEDIYCSRVKYNECPGNQENHKNELKDLFAQNLVVWLVILLSGVFIIFRLSREQSTPLFGEWGRRLFIAIIVLLVIVSYISLPYTYAKLSRSTNFREAIIHYKVTKEQIPLTSFKRLDDRTAKEKRPTNISQNLDGYISPLHGYILGKNQEEVTIFSKEDNFVWHIPKSTIRLVKVEKLGDVLQFHIEGSKEGSDTGPPL